MRSLPYRPDIEGLRAVAVVSVIAYHLVPGAVPGGNLGVDMFFVLSGYLITALIRAEQDRGVFSLAGFYERRVRRILPVLVVVLAATSIAAAFVLLPHDLVDYGRSLVAAVGFVANVHFWLVIDYFAPIAAEKPLLHTWSLGVEEQFYLLFPLLMVALKNRSRAVAIAVFALVVVASLGLNFALKLVGGGTFSYYMLPSRAWELAVGALVALLSGRARVPRGVPQAVSLLGVGAIVVGLAEGKVAVLPAALPIVAGTALLVWAEGRATSPIGRLLASAPMTFVGRISYSLYLWHWPILVLMRYRLVREPTVLDYALAVAAMLIAATASWYLVEKPFRDRSRPFRPLGLGLAGACLALVVGAGALVAGRGWPDRFPPEAAVVNDALGTHARCAGWDGIRFAGGRACALGRPDARPETAELVLFGNSHAQMYGPVLDTILKETNRPGLLVGMTECLPTPLLNVDARCARLASETFAAIEALPKVRTVVIGLTWDQAKARFVDAEWRERPGPWRDALAAGLDDLLDRIERSGRRAVLIGPIPHPSWDVASVVGRNLAFGRPQVPPAFETVAAFEERFGPLIERFQARLGAAFVRPEVVFCGAERCDYLKDGRALYSDGNHIAAAELPRFTPLVRAGVMAVSR